MQLLQPFITKTSHCMTTPLPRSRSPAQLECSGRFYRGYNMKRGDRGDIVMAEGGGGSALCLYKFYPAPDCSVRFSCSSFSVGAASPSPASCTRKLVTKAGSRPARRWCGATPPEPLVSAEPVLVGYMDLGAGLAPQASEVQCMIVLGMKASSPQGSPRDRFRCSVSCVRPSPGAGAGAGCRCGQVNTATRQQQRRRGKRKQKKTTSRKPDLPSLLLGGGSRLSRVGRSAASAASALTRIIGGVEASPGSVPWQASLAVSGEVTIST